MCKGLTYFFISLIFGGLLGGCILEQKEESFFYKDKKIGMELDSSIAIQLSSLPLKCLDQEFPNKLNQVLNDSADIQFPRELHPAFYGCFDWHSSVHGHWLLVATIKRFDNLSNDSIIRKKLETHLTRPNIQTELEYFKKKQNATFERTYGWAWILKLQEELNDWDDPLGRELARNLQPLSDYLLNQFKVFLPKLSYPIRSGEHPNTAFGLSFAFDYVQSIGDSQSMRFFTTHALRLYGKDRRTNLFLEPSGFDFLSPSLTEAELMSKIMNPRDFHDWIAEFMPGIINSSFTIKEAEVTDRTDGKLVHLDGLNFSRAWCLYQIASRYKHYGHLRLVADRHLAHSLPFVVDGNYEGEHWLASFACYALIKRNA